MKSIGGPLQRRELKAGPLSTTSRPTRSKGFLRNGLHPVLLAPVCFTANANGAHAKATRRPRAWISLERTAPQVGRPPAAPQRLRRQPSRRPDAAGHIGSFLLSLASPAGARALLAGWLGAVGLLFRRERVFWGYGGRRGGPEVAWGGYGQKARAGFSRSSLTPRESTPGLGRCKRQRGVLHAHFLPSSGAQRVLASVCAASPAALTCSRSRKRTEPRG